MALSTVSGTGTQSSTQNPQVSGQSSAGGQSSNIQPGTTNSLLNSDTGGVPLGGSNLTTVSLGSSTSAGQISNPPVKHHHANPTLVGLTIGLFVIAVIMFWLTSHSEKNTTN